VQISVALSLAWGQPKAITAIAHKLARLVYRMLRYGQTYVDKGMEHYEQRFRQQRIKWLKKQAMELNLQLVSRHNKHEQFLGAARVSARLPAKDRIEAGTAGTSMLKDSLTPSSERRTVVARICPFRNRDGRQDSGT